jgi:hypothetical protein
MRCNAPERFAGQALRNAARSLLGLGWSGSPAASCIERLYRTRRTCLNVYDPDISNVYGTMVSFLFTAQCEAVRVEGPRF